ncbi:hypothetical protein Vafri_20787 [Volvox africanus]|uniref:Uncharacterized protein n=1 Tax=Volvox africanus TaxID=51714 RepID=A0A8J4BXN1_9CHLO|nr:hypothetical protein Vafri_20787 [Volvox africanus]
MHIIKECLCNRYLHNPGSSPRASCQAKFESRRPPAPYNGSQAHEHLIHLNSCSWCGCFQWQCGHHHRHRGAVALGAVAQGTAVSGVEGSVGQQQITAVYCNRGAGGTSRSAFGGYDAGHEGLGDTSRVTGSGSAGGVVQSSSQHRGVVDGESAETETREEAGTHHPLRAPPRKPLQKDQPQQPPQQQEQQQERQQQQQQQQEVLEATESRSCLGVVCSQSGQIITPYRTVSRRGKRGRNGLSPPPRRAWNPGINALPHSLISESGTGPPQPRPQSPSVPATLQNLQPHPPLESPLAWGPRPLPTLEPSLGQQSVSDRPSQRMPPPESSLVPTSPELGDIFQLSVGSTTPDGQRWVSEPLKCTVDGEKAGPVSGGDTGSDLVTGVPMASASMGAAFRSALRRCRCLDEVEALLSGQAQPLPQPLSPPPPLFSSIDSLNVPCLTAVFSALPRLPEAFTAAGRRQLRRTVTMRLTAPVLRAAERGDVDAAGAAIMTAALAHLGPDVIDPGTGRTDLLDALADAGLTACRLALEPSRVRIGDNVGEPTPHERRYGHSPRSYSTLLYGMAKLGFRPDDMWLERYLSRSTNQLHNFPPRDLSAVMWALAVLQYRPEDAWLEELLSVWPTAQSLSGLQAGRGAGVGEADGPRDGMSEPVGVPAAPLRHHRADAHSLSLVLWALWRLGVAAPPAWLDGAVDLVAVPSAPTDTAPTSFCSRQNGAATPPLRSPPRVMAAPFAGATCQSLALVSYCLARMGHTPSPGVSAALLAAAEPLLQRGSAQDLVLLLTGVAHWPRRGGAAVAASSDAAAVIPERWLQQLCLALRPRLAGCSAQALVLALFALSHLGFSPGTAWLQEHEAALRPLIASGHLDGRAAARVAAAWARLRYCPGRNVLHRLLKILVTAATAGGDKYGSSSASAGTTVTATRQRSRLSARLLAEGLYGIAVLVAARWTAGEHQVPPPGPPIPAAGPLLATIHLRALLAASQSCLPYSYLDEALMHLRAWQLLRLAPPHQWLTNLTAVARTKLHSAPPKVLLESLQLLVWPGWRQLRELDSRTTLYSTPRPRAYHHGQDQVLHQSHCNQHQGSVSLLAASADANDPSVIVSGGGGGGLPVSAALVSAIVEHLAAALPGMSLGQLADFAEVMATLRVRPKRTWLRGLLDAIRVGIRSGQYCGDRDLDPDLDLDPQPVPAGLQDWVVKGAPDGGRAPGEEVAGIRALRAVVQLAAAVGDTALQHVAAELLSRYGIVATEGSTASTHHAPGVAITGRDGSSRSPLQPMLQRPPSPRTWQPRGPTLERVSEPPVLDWGIVGDEGRGGAGAVREGACGAPAWTGGNK